MTGGVVALRVMTGGVAALRVMTGGVAALWVMTGGVAALWVMTGGVAADRRGGAPGCQGRAEGDDAADDAVAAEHGAGVAADHTARPRPDAARRTRETVHVHSAARPLSSSHRLSTS
jgi:hypothetical protein